MKFGNESKLVVGRQTYQLKDKPKDHLIEMNEPHGEILKIFSVMTRLLYEASPELR